MKNAMPSIGLRSNLPEKSIFKQRNKDENQKKDYTQEIANKQPEPLKNHYKKGEYNAMYFNAANRSDHMILAS